MQSRRADRLWLLLWEGYHTCLLLLPPRQFDPCGLENPPALSSGRFSRPACRFGGWSLGHLCMYQRRALGWLTPSGSPRGKLWHHLRRSEIWGQMKPTTSGNYRAHSTSCTCNPHASRPVALPLPRCTSDRQGSEELTTFPVYSTSLTRVNDEGRGLLSPSLSGRSGLQRLAHLWKALMILLK